MTTPEPAEPPGRSRLTVALLGPAASLRGARTLLGIGLIDSTGTGLYLAGSAVYFVAVLGLSAAQVGFGLSVAGLLGLVCQPVLGWLADRHGPRQVLALLHVWRALSFGVLLLADTYWQFLIAVAMIGVGQQALSPIYQALVERTVGADGRLAMMARSRVVYNVGFSLGGLAATVAIGYGTRTGFSMIMLGNAVFCLTAAAMLAAAPAADGETGSARRAPLRLAHLRNTRHLAVAAINGVLSLHISLLGVGIPLWVTLHTGAPRSTVGVLLVVNTVVAVLGQVWASKGSDTLDGSVTALQRGGWALVGCCLFFVAAAHTHATPVVVVLLIAGVIVMTGAELFQSAGGWGVSYALAPEEGRAEYLATFNLGTGLQFVVGPMIVTAGVIDRGTIGWVVFPGCLAVATLAVRPLVAVAERPAPAGKGVTEHA
ncbi:MFS transporter [Streptomyces sp. NPDC007901]|uniref:MFS transporter n=1 Tax=Streptomyces sp. NPDC007901 TaxID=3364785 RepID=UPI0036E0ADB7